MNAGLATVEAAKLARPGKVKGLSIERVQEPDEVMGELPVTLISCAVPANPTLVTVPGPPPPGQVSGPAAAMAQPILKAVFSVGGAVPASLNPAAGVVQVAAGAHAVTEPALTVVQFPAKPCSTSPPLLLET